jgi:hypothetical protein
VWRFVLYQNIQRYRELLSQVLSDAERERVQALLREAEAELADLETLSTPAPVQRNDDLREVAERSVDDTVETLGALGACLQLWWPAKRSLLLVAQKNLPLSLLRAVTNGDVDREAVPVTAFARDTQVALEDAEAASIVEHYRQTLHSANVRAAIASPVRSPAGAIAGVLTAYFVHPMHFDEDLLEKAERLANGTGAALSVLDPWNG